jgi:hypothetical protein
MLSAVTASLHAEPNPTLLDLAKQKFGSDSLTDGELALFINTQKGEPASALTGDLHRDNPAFANDWTHNRLLHAERLAWLCTDQEALKRITPHGIQIRGMRIAGKLELEFAQIPFPFRTFKCAFTDEVDLHQAHFATLEFQTTYFKGVSAYGIKTDGGFSFTEHCVNHGEINAVGARIGANVQCDSGQFINPAGQALDFNSARIEGNVFLRHDFEAQGTVNFSVATVGGNFECIGGHFLKPNGIALTANTTKIVGNMFLQDSFVADGEVDLSNSEMKALVLLNVSEISKTTLTLRAAKLARLRDQAGNWPPVGKLILDGLTYDRIDTRSPTDFRNRIAWLHRQPTEQYSPQPYEQLALVLRTMGHQREAQKIMVARNNDYGDYLAQQDGKGRFLFREWWWYNVFGWLIGYGYAPSRAFFISLAMIALGCGIFSIAYKHDIISPTTEKAYETTPKGLKKLSQDYPKFNAFVFSLESFTPLLKLDQVSNWTANAYRGKCLKRLGLQLTAGSLVRVYLWFHIMSGWLLTSLWVAGLTGLAKS